MPWLEWGMSTREGCRALMASMITGAYSSGLKAASSGWA